MAVSLFRWLGKWMGGTYLGFLREGTVGFGDDDYRAFPEDGVHLDFDFVL